MSYSPYFNTNQDFTYVSGWGTKPVYLVASGGSGLILLQNGNVGIGTVNPGATFDVSGNTSSYIGTNRPNVTLRGPQGHVLIGNNTGLSNAYATYLIQGNTILELYAQKTGALVCVPILSFSTSDTGQNAFLGGLHFLCADSPLTDKRGALIVSQNVSSTTGAVSGFIAFSTNAEGSMSEKMRIQEAGQVIIGRSTVLTQKFYVDTSAFTNVAKVAGAFRNYDTAHASLELWNSDTSGDNSFQKFYTDAGATLRGSITYNRGAGLTAYNTTSDLRLKENISGLDLSVIDKIHPVTWDWKHGYANRRGIGFVAQDLINIVPEAVTSGDNQPIDSITGEFKQWAVDASKLVPYLVMELKSLRTRVSQLEFLVSGRVT